MSSKPKAPDPYKTAAAQAGMNRDTATQQQLLNMVDQTNPWGSTSYSQNGTTTYTDAQGKLVTVPKFTQNTTLSSGQQAIFDQTQGAELGLATLANQQLGNLQEHMAQPFEFNNRDAEMWAYDLASPRLLEQQGNNQTALREQLINSGLRPGTRAYDMEMERLGRNNSDQLNQLALTGRGQAFNEALTTRNQPINEIAALLSGAQVENPAQMSGPTPQAQIGGVDYMGMVNQNYQNQLASHNSFMGGLFGSIGAGAGLAASLSDARAKENISRVGTLDNGLPVYAYRYKSGGPMQIGLMAHDVERLKPQAIVERPDGLKAVNYGMAVQS